MVWTEPKVIIYMHCLHHNLPPGISLYMLGMESNPIQLRYCRRPVKSVNNETIESVMKMTMYPKTRSAMHPFQVYWQSQMRLAFNLCRGNLQRAIDDASSFNNINMCSLDIFLKQINIVCARTRQGLVILSKIVSIMKNTGSRDL